MSSGATQQPCWVISVKGVNERMSLIEKIREIDEWGKELPTKFWPAVVSAWSRIDLGSRSGRSWRAFISWRRKRLEEQRRVRAARSDNPATAKQIVYLKHLGVRRLSRFDKPSATAEISRQQLRAQRLCFRRLKERVESWEHVRLHEYPELYRAEVIAYLIREYTDQFRSFVRSRVVGASGTLTQEKINSVIKSLTSEDSRWWQGPDCSLVFYERLGEFHPNCLDGGSPDRRRSVREEPRRQGCLGLLLVLGIMAAGVIVMTIDQTS